MQPWSMVWRVNNAGALDGKVAIVTGTSRGVGVGIAHELLLEGRRSSAARGRRSTRSPAPRRTRVGRALCAMVCDQGDYRAIDAFVARVVDTYGRIDILVNNAGGTVPTPHVEDIPELVQQIQGARAATTTSSARCCSTRSPSR